MSHLIVTASQRAVYCWDVQFTQEETEAQRDQETCPKSSIVDEFFTSMSGPAESVYLVCLTPKPMLFSPVPYAPQHPLWEVSI